MAVARFRPPDALLQTSPAAAAKEQRQIENRKKGAVCLHCFVSNARGLRFATLKTDFPSNPPSLARLTFVVRLHMDGDADTCKYFAQRCFDAIANPV